MTDKSTDMVFPLPPEFGGETFQPANNQAVEPVQEKRILETIRESLKGASEINPELKTDYFPFPASRKVVVNFKTWVFLLELEKHKEFAENVQTFLRGLGYKPKFRQLTFSPGLIAGVGREFVEVWLDKAEGAIFCKSFGNLLYVSLRAAYTPFLSWLRIAAFLILCILPPLAVYENWAIPDSQSQICSNYDYCGYYFEDDVWVLEKTILNVIGLGIVFSVISLVRGNGFLGWLVADYDEIYRDDIATVWDMSELAITATADEMDLQQVPVGESFQQAELQRSQVPKRRPRF